MAAKDIERKAKKVKLVLLDVDGVLTDGRIIYDSDGRDLKLFDVHDGLGVHILGEMGIPVILVTAKGSRTIPPRARDMRIAEIFADVKPKSSVLEPLTKKYGVTAQEVCFVGDDLVDISLLKRVGFPVATANASADVKKLAAYVTSKHGGRGAVRETAELILKAQGKWREALKKYDV